MKKGLANLVESRLESMKAERDRLTEAWAPYIQSVEAYMEKQGKTLNENDKRNIN